MLIIKCATYFFLSYRLKTSSWHFSIFIFSGKNGKSSWSSYSFLWNSTSTTSIYFLPLFSSQFLQTFYQTLMFFAFVRNAKSFAIVILVFFLFFPSLTFSGQAGKSYFQSFIQLLLWARVTRIGLNSTICHVLSTHVL